MTSKFIGLLVLSVIIISVLLYYFTRDPPFTHNIIEPQSLFLVDDFNKGYSSNLLPESKIGNKYTLSFWIYIKNIPENANWITDFNKPKGIISHFSSPNVYYLPSEGQLRISIGYKDDNNVLQKYNFDISSINYQKWDHYIVSVDNRYSDIYQNGKMIKSTYLPNVPWISNRMLYIGEINNNFNGHIYMVEYINDTIDSKKAEKLYKKSRNSNVLKRRVKSYSEYYFDKNKDN